MSKSPQPEHGDRHQQTALVVVNLGAVQTGLGRARWRHTKTCFAHSVVFGMPK